MKTHIHADDWAYFRLVTIIYVFILIANDYAHFTLITIHTFIHRFIKAENRDSYPP